MQAKVEGQEIVMAEEAQPGAQVIDLMEALRASLERKAPAKGKAREMATATAAPEGRKGPKRVTAAQPVAATPRKAAKKL